MQHHLNAPFGLKTILLALALGQGATVLAQQGAPAVPAEPTLDVQRYVLDGEIPLTAEETRAILAPFLGEKRTLRHIEAAAAALERGMKERGFVFHRMFVPAQKPVGGDVRLQVIQFKLGLVEVTGNEHFSSENIRRSLTSLKEGELPEVHVLGRDVSASNLNPAKHVTVTFKESRQPNTVDAVVKVNDAPVMNYFATLTGNQAVAGDGPVQNTYRATFGFQHSNLFDRDHVMTLSYTTDPGNPSRVSLLGAFYQVPLYGTGMSLSGSFTSSDVSSGTVQQGAGVFDISGSGRFMGIRLTRALNRINTLQQSVAVAFDDRFFENRTTFNGAPVQPDVGSRVLSLHYQFRDELAWGNAAGNLDYAVNLGGGSSNTDANHTANGGNKNWDAWRFSLEAAIQAAGWQYTGRLKGQFANKSLISGEQFGLGGSNSVRGFADRVVAGDYGHQWNLEAMAPGFGELQIRPVFFVEGGQVHARSTGTSETVMSAGAGLRLSNQKLQASLDLAQVIDRNSTAPGGRPVRMHFSLSYRF